MAEGKSHTRKAGREVRGRAGSGGRGEGGGKYGVDARAKQVKKNEGGRTRRKVGGGRLPCLLVG